MVALTMRLRRTLSRAAQRCVKPTVNTMRFHANCISDGGYYQLWLETEESDAEETDIIQLSAGVPLSLLTGSGPPGVGDQSITARAERVEA
jgi:hypothetical protein